MNPNLDTIYRNELWKQLQNALETYYADTASLNVAPPLDQQAISAYVEQQQHERPAGSLADALTHVLHGMTTYTVHTPHPRYFGLFNPRAAFPGILADTITATFNPQLAAWSHAPFAVEVESYLVREIGHRFGYLREQVDGVFTTGGAEANLTAVLIALTQRFSDYADEGLLGIAGRPMIYASSESHHSVVKAARAAGLGSTSVRIIPVDPAFQMIPSLLEAQIAQDTADQAVPFLVVATGGTTAAGAIDPLQEIAAVCQQHGLWLHLDAAYGGAVVLEETTRHLLAGAAQADSITFDAHKWLSMPMSTSLLLTRHPELLNRTFGVTTDYMPKEAGRMPVTDPFTHSIQWSRRFSGLKLYLSLLMMGWEGFAQMIRQQVHLGHLLRDLLAENHWVVKNDTELPIICFTDPVVAEDTDFATFVGDTVVASGQAWLSTYQLGDTRTLRVCITNYATQEDDLRTLIDLLNAARTTYKSHH